MKNEYLVRGITNDCEEIIYQRKINPYQLNVKSYILTNKEMLVKING